MDTENRPAVAKWEGWAGSFDQQMQTVIYRTGFPGGSAGEESTYHARDPSWITGSGRSRGEGIHYPFQYSWTSLMAQMVKNSPAMQETWVRSLGWEDPLEEGMATHSNGYPGQSLENSMDCIVHGVAESDTAEFPHYRCTT